MLSWWLPENVSTFGGADRSPLLRSSTTSPTAIFFAVQVTLLVFLVMYRDRPGRRATYTHGNTTLEIVWTIVPALILVVLALHEPRDLGRDQGERSRRATSRSQVTAKQFNWEITYPGPTASSAPTTTSRWTTTCTCR